MPLGHISFISYTTLQDASVSRMLTISNVRAVFHVPLSIQAHAELQALQSEISSITLSGDADKWVCTWGAQVFKTTDYYKFFFREVIAHAAFK